MAEPALDPVYPVVFIDAVNVKIRDGQVANRPIYVALAVTCDGQRDILGLWAGDGGEGAKHWLHVLTELKNRGVNDVLMVVCDGLTGLSSTEFGGERELRRCGCRGCGVQVRAGQLGRCASASRFVERCARALVVAYRLATLRWTPRTDTAARATRARWL